MVHSKKQGGQAISGSFWHAGADYSPFANSSVHENMKKRDGLGYSGYLKDLK
jgi:hypothetical protein